MDSGLTIRPDTDAGFETQVDPVELIRHHYSGMTLFLKLEVVLVIKQSKFFKTQLGTRLQFLPS